MSGGEAVRVRETPTALTYQMVEEAGTDMGQMLLKKESMKSLKNMDNDLAKALGRISGAWAVTSLPFLSPG